MIILFNTLEKSSLEMNKMWYKNDLAKKRWNSLTNLERQCVKDEFDNILLKDMKKFTDPCKEPEEKCQTFCNNSKILEKQIHLNKKFKDLILYSSHPTDVTIKGSQLLPFCSVGHRTDRFEQNVAQGFIHLPNTTDIYEFCTNSYQRITDIGICTTISFKEVILNFRIKVKSVFILEYMAYLNTIFDNVKFCFISCFW